MNQISVPFEGPAEQLLAALTAAGAELWVEDGSLRFRAPNGIINDGRRREIAAHRDAILALLGRQSRPPSRMITALPANSKPPLSFAQRRFWFLDQLNPGSPIYNIGGAIRIKEAIDLRAFGLAVDDLYARHAAFRTRIYEENGAPCLEILPRPRIALDIVDVSDAPPADRAEAAREFGQVALRTQFDLAAGKLALTRIVRFRPTDHLMLFAVHHIVSDGVSLDIVWRELGELYQARLTKRHPRLVPLPLAYGDFAAWEQSQAATEDFGGHLAFWRETLADAPALLTLPTYKPRPAIASLRGARYHARLDGKLIDRLRQIARAEEVTLFVALLAVWQALLARLSGQNDIVVGTPVSTREDEALEGVVGCFINNVALRGNLNGAPGYGELLRRTKRVVLDAFRHASLPFETVVAQLKPPRTAAYTPIFQTLFSMLSSTGANASPGSSHFERMDETGTARFDLSLELTTSSDDPDGGLRAAYEYAVDIYDAATIERMHRQFELLLIAVCADPARALVDVPLLTIEEAHQIGATWNETNHEFDRELTAPGLISAAAARSPKAIAVRSETDSMDFETFESRANRLANTLIARGAGPGKRVAVCLARTVDLPIALTAVWKTGAAYVPLDPVHPAARMDFVLEDASPVCLVSTSDLASCDISTVLLDEDAADIAAASAVAPDVTIDPNSLAYVIYTSGSTGMPKGVEVLHRNVAAFLEAMRMEPGLDAGERLLAVTTPTFDIAGLEFWLPLVVGGCVVIASEMATMDGEALAELLVEHDIRMLQATPATWRLLLEAGWQGKPDLKALCGGEAMPPDLAAQIIGRVEALWNLYGPTETTIWSTSHRVSVADLEVGRIPIGRPIANTRVYVLEPSGLMAPIGAPGELVIAGEGVAAGYRNKQDLTRQRFAEATPFRRREILYRTGDRARWRPDGTLDFLGRDDGQVKIRGFRIELGEVEAALATHPKVRQAYAAVSESNGSGVLVAYLVFEPEEEPTTSELRRYIRARLPEYMTPSLFVSLEAPPLSANGKIDRRQLPDPFLAARKARNLPDPLSPGLEQTLGEIWSAHLEVASVRPHDNFFELGGHSLLSMRVAAAFARQTGLRLDPRALFFQTLREVAAGAAPQSGGAA